MPIFQKNTKQSVLTTFDVAPGTCQDLLDELI